MKDDIESGYDIFNVDVCPKIISIPMKTHFVPINHLTDELPDYFFRVLVGAVNVVTPGDNSWKPERSL